MSMLAHKMSFPSQGDVLTLDRASALKIEVEPQLCEQWGGLDATSMIPSEILPMYLGS